MVAHVLGYQLIREGYKWKWSELFTWEDENLGSLQAKYDLVVLRKGWKIDGFGEKLWMRFFTVKLAYDLLCKRSNVEEDRLSFTLWNRWQVLWLAIVWTVWCARNELIFNEKPFNSHVVFEMVQLNALAWLKAKSTSFCFNLVNWLMNPEECILCL
ncbi:hypothetical protein RJT34_25021 [Clitoria ternatea]|uniref:Reverse transcriptase zinc-binding domain-containing protein n=1 Tax=Clitoria ternatea TaxID=43366 RepID=A0AAN9FP60_CLITE